MEKMKNKHLWTVVIVSILLSTAPAISLAVTSVTASPSVTSVPLGRSTTLSITWRVITNACTSISSAQGTFFLENIDGTSLQINPSSISKACTTGVETVRETLRVPSNVIYQANKLGGRRIVYSRTFTEPSPTGAGPTASGLVVLNLGGGGAGELTVSRISLRFDDDSPERIVQPGTKLSVNAELTFSGNGLLQGSWELADPTSTMGDPLFHPLRLIREQLAYGREIVLRSPPLPTDNAGVYLLRLRITKPMLDGELPVLRYVVLNSAATASRVPSTIELSHPAPSIMLAPDTRFAWEPVPGSHAYQLEYFREPAPTIEDMLPDLGIPTVPQTPPVSGPPTTGLLLKGTTSEASLSDLTRARLVSGETYLWRVLAIDADGAVIGISDFRPIRVPGQRTGAGGQ